MVKYASIWYTMVRTVTDPSETKAIRVIIFLCSFTITYNEPTTFAMFFRRIGMEMNEIEIFARRLLNLYLSRRGRSSQRRCYGVMLHFKERCDDESAE
jgi:hypothetical protein